eukprot:CAMPEP_0201537090 /NCGR_PEP_ID=MMETSP0161_2-20130828/63787_1 /ASSEMBLY_ACC=CAM_ASM_000251 /TAXON_ID=180227 /ORGANISM="Neoparamoeba aestuarina, Strain SoJaBio B1-5/56/2" /LENGTH=132 /DNA_ID=CAMNT_0047943195 /DNA_START=54 /DNA_END=449 /DNA_ORIENTATION=+
MSPTLWTMLPPSKKPTLKQLKESELGALVDCKMNKVEDEGFDDDFAFAEENLIKDTCNFVILEIGKDGKVIANNEEQQDSFSSSPPSSDFKEFVAILSGYEGSDEEEGTEKGDSESSSAEIKTVFQQIPVNF